jgi:DMSO reductase anchor subunit
MRPAFSVVLFTTLLGAGQGLFLALYAAELAAFVHRVPVPPPSFFVSGSGIALVLTLGGLVASFFHLGRPERAWRAAAGWRTSWLSREVILLPLFAGAVAMYGAAHALGSAHTAVIGAAAAVLSVALFLATGMIYAAIRFLQEWSTPFTPLNYLLLGCASGTTLAAAIAAALGSPLARPYVAAALVLTAVAALMRIASLARNARLRPKSTLRTAIGVEHPKIAQRSQGFTGSSFNNREFFHGQTPATMRAIKWAFLLGAFAVPLALLAAARPEPGAVLTAVAFACQFLGLLAERWYFLADARHPQNLYYQAAS